MNGMYFNASCSLANSPVGPILDIRVLSSNAGGIDQVLARQWVEAALGRPPAQTIAGNYIWVLM